MAAKLECEICGGKLIGKPGGIFECENCGTEYSTEWAKAKIQEITGTVKVEGTVEVTGKVQVEGAVTAQNLIKRGMLALEEKKLEEAENCLREALKADAENAEAYLGLSMVKRKKPTKEDYAEAYIHRGLEAKNDSDTDRAIQFARQELKEWFKELDEKRAALLAEAKERLPESRKRIAPYQGLLAAGTFNTIGLQEDGTVITAGSNRDDVSGWRDITAIAVGASFIAGLKADGTVLQTGRSIDVSAWTDITAIAVGLTHIVGLKKDGTVVATGDNSKHQCDVSGWMDIVAVAAGFHHTVGLRSDGTVIAVGDNQWQQCDVSEWTDIVAIAAGPSDTLGIKADGTVFVSKVYRDLSSWTDIVAISAAGETILGLKADGTVVCDSSSSGGHSFLNISKWADIVAIAVGKYHVVGLKADGTVVADGSYREKKHWITNGQCDVRQWKLFRPDKEKEPDYAAAGALQEKGTEDALLKAAELFKPLRHYKDSAERAKICRQTYETMKMSRERAELNAEKAALSTELANLKGLFSGKRRKEIETRLAEIETEIKKLQ